MCVIHQPASLFRGGGYESHTSIFAKHYPHSYIMDYFSKSFPIFYLFKSHFHLVILGLKNIFLNNKWGLACSGASTVVLECPKGRQ